MDPEENFYIRVIEYGIKHPDGFTYDEIIDSKELGLKDWEKEAMKKYFHNAYVNFNQNESMGKSGSAETLFLLINRKNLNFIHDSNKYTINFDSHFKYIDYQELKFARENAKTAKTLSLCAIGIAVLSIAAAIFAQLWLNTVRIDPEQINRILNALKP